MRWVDWPPRRKFTSFMAFVWCIVVPPGIIFRHEFPHELSVKVGYGVDAVIVGTLIFDFYLSRKEARRATVIELVPLGELPHTSIKVDTLRERDVCPICLESGADDVVELDCSHRFHSECIKQALGYKRECPLCKNPIFPPAEEV